MTNPTLLPCPFCGHTDTDDVLYCAVDEYHRAYVTCSNCFAEGPVVNGKEIGSDEAIEQAAAAWNQRSAWQPIDTAPRDGTKILAWDGDELQIVWCSEGGGWISDKEQEYYPGEREYPTHWQPLHSPPPVTPSAPHASTEGQSITVEGIQGPHAHLNGTYAVDSVGRGIITP
jgi:Lar family restriction alleviation protein